MMMTNDRRRLEPVMLSSMGINASLRLQTLLAGEHIPAFGPWMGVNERTITRAHDGVGENGVVGLSGGKLQRPNHGDGLASLQHEIARAELREPNPPSLFDDDSICTFNRLRGGEA